MISDAEIEERARQIAADKMGLVKDVTGSRLPAELWRQCIPQAQKEAERDRRWIEKFAK